MFGFNFSQDPVQFVLPKVRSNGVYRLDLAVLSLELKIMKASNPTQNLPKEADSAVSNNAVNSIWSRSALFFNNVPVNQSTQHHHLKSFLHKLIDTGRMEKVTSQVEGFWYETAGRIDNSSSPSFINRQDIFKKSDGTYTKNARLAGFIYHDMVSSILYFERIALNDMIIRLAIRLVCLLASK